MKPERNTGTSRLSSRKKQWVGLLTGEVALWISYLKSPGTDAAIGIQALDWGRETEDADRFGNMETH